jgi:CRP-like cAMP-binding protein
LAEDHLTRQVRRELLLAIRGPGDVVGELSAIDAHLRSASATALTAVQAHVIDGARFVACRHPGLTFELLRYLAANLRDSDAERLKYVAASSNARLAQLLVRLARQHGVETEEGVMIGLPMTQQAATSREAVARALRVLRERGIIRTSRKRIVLVRPEVLNVLSASVPTDTQPR